jgi:hypothetical protein
MQTSPSFSTKPQGAPEGPNVRQIPYKTGSENQTPAVSDCKTGKAAGVSGSFIRYVFAFQKPAISGLQPVKVQAFATLG